jgi:hypothetical protein
MDAHLHKCDDTDFDDKNSPHVKYVVLHGCGLELVDDIYRRPYILVIYLPLNENRTLQIFQISHFPKVHHCS